MNLIKVAPTILLLFASNTFMTLAWYGHLKFKFLEGKSLWTVILISWCIALFEYVFMIPANRLSYGLLTAYQLKILQEGITLTVFVVFAWLFLDEPIHWKYGASFVLIFFAVWIAFSDWK